ncbi:4Fe-4S dicluster domain-containing protein [Congregibacter variabilis]|uniref:4Fe-4S dicluster domain-containing protein n=1 Tax=Congregibacter variabilis TaxID=3081200 RepID=A0ABZ0I0U1_9GAMM|nr:4Fe-4S dicluster domain-containing protein [Congregibacter sp. IMCC43200]
MQRWNADQLQSLIERLLHDDYRVIGPTVRDEALVYDDIRSLPTGWADSQDAGHYRLSHNDDQSRFAFNVGPCTWKQFLYPPEEAIFRVVDGEFVSARETPGKMAFIGVRACELSAIGIQDRVFTGDIVDPGYAARRKELLIVAVNCSQASASCFCSSTGDGPAVGAGADLVLTEFDPQDPFYLVEARSHSGEALLAAIGGTKVTDQELAMIDTALAVTREQMSRSIQMTGLAKDLLETLEHPHWEDVAARCLACGNCTQVCPTCFCSTTREDVDPVSLDVTHVRRWDSCFTKGHSYLSGGVTHQSVKSRYRQWLTHKLASWEAQFGTSGCTGCGRCITWCPVGIDITRETAKVREVP